MSNKLLLFLFLFFTTLLHSSNVININYAAVDMDDFNISFVEDVDNSFNIDDISNKKFTTIPNNYAHGNTPLTIWLKIQLQNQTKIPKKVYIHNNYAYLSKNITIYEFSRKKLIDQNIYNILDEHSNKLLGSSLIYPISLKPHLSKTIYIKIVPIVTQILNINLYDESNHLIALISKNLFSNIILITLFSLAFYNIVLFLFNRKKEFIFYSIYLINAALGLSYLYGSIFHNLGIYGEDVYWLNITAILVPGFLVLFIKAIFNFKDTDKKLDKLLSYTLYLVAIDTAIAIFIDLQYAIYLVKFVYLYSFVSIFYIGYKLKDKNHPLTYIFFGAYTIYIVGFSITILTLMGITPLNLLTFHASGIALVIEALLFSYLIHYHFKILEQRIVKQNNSLILKNQKAQLGDMIGAITHQWKQPLTSVASVIMLLQYKLKEKEYEREYIDSKITQINDKVLFLAETIDDFKDFFNPKKTKTDCEIDKLLYRAIDLSKDDTLKDEILIKQDLSFTKSVAVFENELLHIILNIIQNSKEAFKSNKNKLHDVKMIKIIGFTEDNKTYIDIIDNAGGISKENLPYIFHENYTTKANEDGTGLGLYLSKVIIEEHLHGSIEVKNINNGTMFRIIL